MNRLIHHYSAALGSLAAAPIGGQVIILVARPRHGGKNPFCTLFGRKRAQLLVGFEVAVLKAHAHYRRAVFFRRLDCCILLGADAHRLFAKHVYVTLQSGYAHFRVLPMRRADMHYVGLRLVQHLFVVGVNRRRDSVLAKKRARLVLAEVAYRDKVKPQMFYYVYVSVCDCSATDYSGFHFLLRCG